MLRGVGSWRPFGPPHTQERAPLLAQPEHGFTAARSALRAAMVKHGLRAKPPEPLPPAPTQTQRRLARSATRLLADLAQNPPHARLDAAIAACTGKGAQKLHAWGLRPGLKERPGLLLAVFAIGAATLGVANFVHEHGESLRDTLIDRPGSATAHGLGEALGPEVQLVGALGTEFLSLGAGVWLACATGVAAALTTTLVAPLCVVPVWAMHAKQRHDMSRVLRAYLFVEQPRGHILAGLREDWAAVANHLHAGEVHTPPPNAFGRFTAWVENNPIISRRVGLPEPHPERLAVVHESLLAMHWLHAPHQTVANTDAAQGLPGPLPSSR